ELVALLGEALVGRARLVEVGRLALVDREVGSGPGLERSGVGDARHRSEQRDARVVAVDRAVAPAEAGAVRELETSPQHGAVPARQHHRARLGIVADLEAVEAGGREALGELHRAVAEARAEPRAAAATTIAVGDLELEAQREVAEQLARQPRRTLR